MKKWTIQFRMLARFSTHLFEKLQTSSPTNQHKWTQIKHSIIQIYREKNLQINDQGIPARNQGANTHTHTHSHTHTYPHSLTHTHKHTHTLRYQGIWTSQENCDNRQQGVNEKIFLNGRNSQSHSLWVDLFITLFSSSIETPKVW